MPKVREKIPFTQKSQGISYWKCCINPEKSPASIFSDQILNQAYFSKKFQISKNSIKSEHIICVYNRKFNPTWAGLF